VVVEANVHESIFQSNRAGTGAGALELELQLNAASPSATSQATVDHCQFRDNIATQFGGALSVYGPEGAEVRLQHLDFFNQTSFQGVTGRPGRVAKRSVSAST